MHQRATGSFRTVVIHDQQKISNGPFLSSSLVSMSTHNPEMQQVPTWECRVQHSDAIDSGFEIVWEDIRNTNSSSVGAALATWNWCKYFVVPYGLCPWAEGSVASTGSVQLFLSNDEDAMNSFVAETLAKRFLTSIADDKMDPSKGIFFLIFLQQSMADFETFYEWYTKLEDNWELIEDVTMAPFHPQWTYGVENDPLCIEKRSPFPTVSLVSTKIIDQAGETATQRIVTMNEEILKGKSAREWDFIYDQAVGTKNSVDDQG